MAKNLVSFLFILYPLFVFFGLKHLNKESLLIIFSVLFLLRFVLFRKGSEIQKVVSFVGLGMIALLVVNFFFQEYDLMKYYPVIINIALAIFFLGSLKTTPIIERFARTFEKNFSQNMKSYTRKVTLLWSVFFNLNALVSFYTCNYLSIESWTLYNGFISYILIGLLFLFEYSYRTYYKRKVND